MAWMIIGYFSKLLFIREKKIVSTTHNKKKLMVCFNEFLFT